MANGKNNNIFEKTSFLGANSSQFIQELYADYLTNPQNIPNDILHLPRNLFLKLFFHQKIL